MDANQPIAISRRDLFTSLNAKEATSGSKAFVMDCVEFGLITSILRGSMVDLRGYQVERLLTRRRRASHGLGRLPQRSSPTRPQINSSIDPPHPFKIVEPAECLSA